MEKNKKLIILGIVLIILLVLGLILMIFFGNRRIQTRQGHPVMTALGVKEKIFSPQYIQSQNSIYYLGDQGVKFKKFSLDNNTISDLYPKEIYYIQRVQISPDGTKALVLVEDTTDHYLFEVIDFHKQLINKLDSKISDAQWFNNYLIYSYETETQTILERSDPDGKNRQTLASLDVIATVLSISPDQTKIILYPEPEGYGNNVLYLYSFNDKKLSKLSDQSFVGAVWQPGGTKILTNLYDSQGQIQSLYSINTQDQKSRQYKIKTDLNKIIWLNSDQILVIIEKTGKVDQLYVVNTSNGKTIELANSTDSVINPTAGIENLMSIDSGKIIYFTIDDYLYFLEIGEIKF